jgi:hypothetical protein
VVGGPKTFRLTSGASGYKKVLDGVGVLEGEARDAFRRLQLGFACTPTQKIVDVCDGLPPDRIDVGIVVHRVISMLVYYVE